ncbi:hypothetical protein R1flu_002895 [Riccia fluitans]|uniref:Peptidase A1 domain-containing protein n=1 Tax=Riccia fluitans TaxID=41844 RepID=A0ABD1Y7K7_9MARC
MGALAKISIVLLLLVQAYSCAALRNQQTAWVTKHLHRRKSMETQTNRVGKRKLLAEETTEKTLSNGWRATLIRSSRKVVTEKLTSFEKTLQDVEMSKKRTMFLFKGSGKAKTLRKLLGQEEFESEVEATPGEYSMEFSIGTPPQNFVAIADTGSDLVWLQCVQCNPCFNSSAKFDPSLSSTYQALGCGPSCDVLGPDNQLACTPSCQYSYGYGDNSTTIGNFSVETIWLTDGAGDTVSVANFLFGCGLENTGLFDGTNGLVGLGRGPLSFPSQISQILNSNKFSYCLLTSSDVTDKSPILFGETAVPDGLIRSTPLLPLPAHFITSFYYVSLVDISVGGSPLSIPSTSFQLNVTTEQGGVLFDSGTTYTTLESSAYQLVIGAFKRGIETLNPSISPVDLLDLTGLEVCYGVTGFDTVVIPALTFHFDSADFDLPADNTMEKFTDESSNNFICLALTESPVASSSIFGNRQQQNFQVLYDLDNGSIGWVPADCASI